MQTDYLNLKCLCIYVDPQRELRSSILELCLGVFNNESTLLAVNFAINEAVTV